MNEEETLEIKESSEKSSDKIDEESNSQKEDIPETIEEEKKSDDKKITSTIVVEEVISEDKNENDEKIKQKKTDGIPQSMDSIDEIEKIANKNIKFSNETENEKKCKSPSEICNNICLIF